MPTRIATCSPFRSARSSRRCCSRARSCWRRARFPAGSSRSPLDCGMMRAAFAAAGMTEIAYAAAVAIEPLAVLAAAWLVHRATPLAGGALSQRLLAPSLVVLAALGALHDAWFDPRIADSARPARDLDGGGAAALRRADPLGVGARPARSAARREELEERVDGANRGAGSRTRAPAADRRAAQRRGRAARSEERYRVVSELGSDLAFGFRIDLDDHMYDGWVTDAYSRITGYTLDELTGHRVAPAHPPGRSRSPPATVRGDSRRTDP